MIKQAVGARWAKIVRTPRRRGIRGGDALGFVLGSDKENGAAKESVVPFILLVSAGRFWLASACRRFA